MNPKISVLMSVYNGQAYLKEAIDSILNQTFTDFEFVIINDASTDSSKQIIENYRDGRIILINNKENIGLTKSLNKGLKLAKGKYIARMDADDIALPTRLERQYEFMETGKYILSGTFMEAFDENNTYKWEVPTDWETIKALLLFNNCFFHPSVIFRKKEMLENDFLYDETYRYAQDYELFSRVTFKFSSSNLPEVLMKYRIHNNSIGANKQNERHNYDNKIRHRNLTYLKIQPSKQELLIHNNLSSWLVQHNVRIIDSWLYKIYKYNTNLKLINESILYNVLLYRWQVVLQKATHSGIIFILSSKFLHINDKKKIIKTKLKNLLKKIIVYIPVLNTLFKQRASLRTVVDKLARKTDNLNNKILELNAAIDNKNLAIKTLNLKVQTLEKELALAYYNMHFLPKLTVNSKLKKFHNKKKVLKNILTVHQGDRGGAAKSALRLSNQLSNLGYKVDVLLGEHEFELNNNVHVLERDKSDIQKYLHRYQQAASWDDLLNFSSQKIKDLSIFKEADIVHFHNLHGAGGYFSLFDLVELSKLKPTVWSLRDMLSIVGDWKYYLEANDWDAQGKEFPYTNPNYEGMSEHARFNLKAKELIYKNIDTTIVCPAQWLVDKVENSVLKGKNVRLIHNGIDETIFKPYDKEIVREELGLPTDKKILLFQANSGKYNVWKGPEYLERAQRYFQYREDVVFLNIGGDDNNEPGWINIKYIEDENKMAKYFSAADIFIYPSLADICPLTVLEAQSCGLPVVAFRTGGVPEIIKHMETGYISGYKNMDDFIKGIELFLTDSDLQKKASINARKNIEEEFTLDIMTQKYIKVYEDTLWKK